MKVNNCRSISYLFFLLLLLQPWRAEALSITPKTTGCNGGDVRLDRPPGVDTAKHIPVMSQGDSGMCYAYAASQLIDYQRFANGDTDYQHRTSPMALGARYKAKTFLGGLFFGQNPDGGNTCDAIEASRRSCSYDIEEGISSHMYYDRKASSFREGKYQEYYETMFKAWRRWNPGGDSFSSDDYVHRRVSSKEQRQIIHDVLCMDAKLGQQSSIRLVANDVRKILDNTHSEAAFLNGLLDTICDGKSKSYQLGCNEKSNYTGFGDQQELVDVIDKNLEGAGAKPTAISYCSNMLYNHMNSAPSSFGIGLLGKGCGPHVSIIIGRRSVNGVCQYLIQNTWGTNCSPLFRGRVECDLERDPYGNVHKNGGKLWVDEDLLKRNLFQVSHL